MEALVVLKPNLFEMRMPTPRPGRNEILARVRAVSQSAAPTCTWYGRLPGFWPLSFPFTPGHEWAGEIVALGPGAELHGWKIGDRVAGTSHDACGICQKCVEATTASARTTVSRDCIANARTQLHGRRRDVCRPWHQVHLQAARRAVIRRRLADRPRVHRAACRESRRHPAG
jgi:threonine dehydrogenase-like Zn-dependent dehydrogenase